MHNPTPIQHRYEIEPRATHLGGGWRLRCFEGVTEVAGGVFPLDPDLDHEDAVNQAHCDAMNEGESWLAGFVESTSSDAPTADTRIWVGSGPA